MKKSESGELFVLVAGVIKSFAAVLKIGFFRSFPSIALKVFIVLVLTVRGCEVSRGGQGFWDVHESIFGFVRVR